MYYKKKAMKIMDRLHEEGKKRYSNEYIISAHRHCSCHESEIFASTICVCFYCGYQFNPEESKEELTFMKEGDGKERTLLCPMCSIDSVIGNASGYPVDDKVFIARFTRYWFNGCSRIDYGEDVEKLEWIGVEVE